MSGKKILIIDDEFPMRYLIEHQLKREGFHVTLAKDGPDGITAVTQHQPDLVVLDVMMPGMDGFEVCQQIKTTPETSQIPVIFLTASEAKEYKTRAFAVGADDYLTKPFLAEELLAHISAVLKRTERVNTGVISPSSGRVVSIFSPKGGVGTTTLAIQLSEAIIMHENRPVVLIDLDLPVGGIAQMLSLHTHRNILDLLKASTEHFSVPYIRQFTQRHRADLLVVPAPGSFVGTGSKDMIRKLQILLEKLVEGGYQVLLDLGSHLNEITRTAMRQSDMVFVVTSGQSVANKLCEAFLRDAPELGLEARRLLPVVNETHGRIQEVDLTRLPVARIPHTSERSRTRLWLKEQGIRKLVSIVK
ncbi:response regulator [Candidatus Leptofilum sp.]|uniref:response regulator n=1 Tax=Candidatus Leptofilum sp. TaxID=3241576 RepID=UPI003B58E95A